MTVIEIKAQIFDIIVAQEGLQHQLRQYDEVKNQKLQELQKAIKEAKEETNVTKTD